MTHRIPSPRPSSDPLHHASPPLPRRPPLIGPSCPSYAHPSCRRRRAERSPRLGGHRAEFAPEHALAAAVQDRHPHLIIWYGEETGSYWVASSSGLAEVPDAATLTRLLTPAPARR
ncbi:hypothetical protein [Nocardiopsis sp. FIRDI 009]|uniref:hypothetical protein n=1 Tax=Nocardiopsis sp. FIRDI 009 TaxID=714197 RepID=UPI000E23CC4F|nr:hypothetical protein [Nocardiopsis sp. FIRDI 009]